MKLYKIEQTTEFFEETKEAAVYIATDNFQKAHEFAEELYLKVQALNTHPYIGKQVKLKRNKAKEGLRKLFHYNYIVYYFVSEKNKIVYLLRFVHGARSQKQIVTEIQAEEYLEN